MVTSTTGAIIPFIESFGRALKDVAVDTGIPAAGFQTVVAHFNNGDYSTAPDVVSYRPVRTPKGRNPKDLVTLHGSGVSMFLSAGRVRVSPFGESNDLTAGMTEAFLSGVRDVAKVMKSRLDRRENKSDFVVTVYGHQSDSSGLMIRGWHHSRDQYGTVVTCNLFFRDGVINMLSTTAMEGDEPEFRYRNVTASR